MTQHVSDPAAAGRREPGGTRKRMGVSGEPRAQTRAALLEATVSCLIENGYAATTTALIAARSGVARSAQAYYFSSRDELIFEAVRELAESLTATFRTTVAHAKRAGSERRADIVDALWELHSGPLFAALSELWVAARTRPSLRPFLNDVNDQVVAAVEPAWGNHAAAVVAIVRGQAMLLHLAPDEQVAPTWHAIRDSILVTWG